MKTEDDEIRQKKTMIREALKYMMKTDRNAVEEYESKKLYAQRKSLTCCKQSTLCPVSHL